MSMSRSLFPAYATIGDNCVDRYMPAGKCAIGGNALNVAIQLARAGENCAYFGAVGMDDAGNWTRSQLSANGVDHSHLKVVDAATAYTCLDLDAVGERIITFEEFGACANYHPAAEDLSALARFDHIHIGWLKNAPELREKLAEFNVTFSQDVAVNPECQGLDVAFESVGASEDAAYRALEKLLAEGARVAVVTCGSLGSMASDGSQVVKTGVRFVDVVDTTGAGDTFIAGFLSRWKRNDTLQACLDTGRDMAAQTCTHLGGFPQHLRSFS